MKNGQYPEPVLILAFNRPERVASLLESLRHVKPSQIFLSVDGPRSERPSEKTLVKETQRTIELIDWPCSIETNFFDVNLGCGRAVSEGIEWFFDSVERGVILEDDVLPTFDFYRFCHELLEKYQDDPRVFAISGCNFAPESAVSQPASYRFSGITHVWGWATWRRSWEKYEFDMSRWRRRLPLAKRWKAMGGNLGGFLYWTAVFDWMRFGRIDTWDYQWSLAQLADGGLTATSNVNLTDNVGFDKDATHTVHRPDFIIPSSEMPFPLAHPEVTRDYRADRWIRRRVLQESTFSASRMAKENMLQRLAHFTHRNAEDVS